jgi:phosphohistidine phosphatase
MQVYLIRHAHAVDAAEDSERPLSERGRNQVRTLAKFLKRSDALQTRELWHSPLARSRETAKLLTKCLGAHLKLMEVEGLEGGDDPAVVAERLKTRGTSLAIVGHEPHLGALASLLIAGVMEPSRVILKKSAVVALERTEGNWAVRWHVSPELLR